MCKGLLFEHKTWIELSLFNSADLIIEDWNAKIAVLIEIDVLKNFIKFWPFLYFEVSSFIFFVFSDNILCHGEVL